MEQLDMFKLTTECYLFIMNYYTVNKFESLTQIVAGDHEKINSPLYTRHEKGRKRQGLMVFKYTLSGRGIFIKDGVEFVLKEGEGFLWEIGDERVSYFYPPEETAPWEFIWIHSTSGSVKDVMNEIISKWGPRFTITRTDLHLVEIVNFLDKSLEANDARIDATRGSRLVNTFMESIIDHNRNEERNRSYGDLSSKAVKFIKDNLENNIKVQDVAGHLGISREYLTRLFSSQLGEAPSRYIKKEKLERARLLLLSTENPIKKIAYDTGFKNVDRLRALFKEEFGFTPSQYRDMRKNHPKSGWSRNSTIPSPLS